MIHLEECWPTKNPLFRLVAAPVGMYVSDLHRWDHKTWAGGNANNAINNDEDPDELKNGKLDCKGLNYWSMQ